MKSTDEKNIKNQLPPFYYDLCPDNDEIDLYGLFLKLKRKRKIIFTSTLILTLVAVIYAFLAPPVYKTDTSIFPLQGGSSSSLSALAANLPISLPGTNPQTLTVEAILKSRTLKEEIIRKLHLLPIIFPDQWNNKTNSWKNPKDKPTILDGVKFLEKHMSIQTDKETGVITLTVEFPKNPFIAYKIANASLEYTQYLLNKKTWNLAKKYRIFLENQILNTVKLLKQLEIIYSKFLSGQLKEVPIIINAEFVKTILNKETQFNKALNSTSIKNIKEFLSNKHLFDNKNNSFRSVPRYQLNLEKIQWQLQLLQTLLANLIQQYELAKQQELKETIAFQIIDPPYVPNKPYKPKKLLIIIIGFITGVLLGVFLALVKEWWETKSQSLQKV